MKTGYKVSDIMTIKPIKVYKDTSILDCANLMTEQHVGSLLIVDEKDHKKILGIVTEQDLVRKAMAKNLANNTPVNKVMETNLLTIDPKEDLYDALKLMRDNNVRHLPVIDEDGMIGFLTLKGILKIEPQLMELMTEGINLRETIAQETLEEGRCEVCQNYTSRILTLDDGSRVCQECKETL